MNQNSYLRFSDTESGVYRDGHLMPIKERIIHPQATVDTTLIVTNFNRAATVGQAIDSAIRCDQNKGALEILVIDDGSTDESLNVLREKARHQAVNLIALDFNSGSEALPKNIAAHYARGRYLSYLDSDDRIGERDAFDTSLMAMDTDPQAVMSVSNLVFEIRCTREDLAQNMPWVLDVDLYDPPVSLRDHGALEYRRRVAQIHPVYELMNHGYYDALKLMRKSVFKSTGGVVEELQSCGDFGLYIKMHREGHAITVPRDFYIYRLDGGNDSFYSDEYRAYQESMQRAFTLEEIRYRNFSFEELKANCQQEFWDRYNFSKDEIGI